MNAVELTVGRHTAGDGVGVDPIVAAALSRRPTSVEPGLPRHGQESRQRRLACVDGESGLGWPGEPGNGTGLGWPLDLVPESVSTAAEPAAPVADEAPVRRRLGWRRIFGGGAGAPSRGSSAA
jgi:hypothetical protein